ncbi:hypothetical protein ACFQZZ_05270 [Nocardia sp. GCM10030253]|uniref:hypothetical protein n=1 Tax=Nocardia sp. GCM10030253 TaxID=3273404 RepID=UPI00362B77E7
MGGRLALVVGSECVALGELGFTGDLAGGLYAALREVGGWESAMVEDRAVLNPTAAQLVSAIDDAFQVASAARATLLIAFVGHGIATGDGDFFLLAHDSPAMPRSHTAFHLAQGIRERLNESAVDGLVVLVDACETEQGVRGAARRWTDVLADSAGRMELLVAAGSGPAYAGCFTRTILATFADGLPLRGENLLPSDLVGPVADACTRQRPQHLSFTAGTVSAVPGGDPGLWLVPNTARRGDAVSGRPASGFVDHLTRSLVLTDTIRERLIEIVESGSYRLRGVVGPAGCGKSTLMAMLIRPSLVRGLPIGPEYVSAAIFLTVHSSIETVAMELSAQLTARVPGYAEAVRAARELFGSNGSHLDIFDIEVWQPLIAVSRIGTRITIVVDGLDQPEEGSRRLLIAAVADLTRYERLPHVRVIASIREGSGVESALDLTHMHRIELAEPAAVDVATIVGATREGVVSRAHAPALVRPERGRDVVRQPTAPSIAFQPQGWRTPPGSFGSVPPTVPPAADPQDHRTGSGRPPRADRNRRGRRWGREPGPEQREHRDIPPLPPWISDGDVQADDKAPMRDLSDEDTTDEADVRLSRNVVQDSSSAVGGWLFARLLIELGPAATDGVTEFDVAVEQRVRAAIRSGDPEIAGAVGSLLAVLVAAGVGPVLPLELLEAAMAAMGVALESARIRDLTVGLGVLVSRSDPGTSHESLGVTHGRLVAALQIECDRLGVTVVDAHRAILAAIERTGADRAARYARGSAPRHYLACGDTAAAVEYLVHLETSRAADNRDLWTAWLPSITAVSGEDHPDALAARGHLAFARGASGDLAGAIAEYEWLLVVQLRVLGAGHPDLLRSRDNLAYWRGQWRG